MERIVAEHEPALRRFLRVRLALEPDRDDVIQDVFVRLSALDDIGNKLSEGPRQTRSYLFSIASNLIRDRQRRAKVRQADSHESFDDELACQSGHSPEELATASQTINRMRETLNGLGPRCRHAFVLSRMKHKGYQQIASEMGVTVSAVEKHIAKALIALRNCMEGNES